MHYKSITSQSNVKHQVVLQALETVKILSGMDPCYSGKLFLFDGLEGRGRVVKLRGRREGQQVWKKITIMCESITIGTDYMQVTRLIDYEQFCGSSATDKDGEVKLLPLAQRIKAGQLAEVASTIIALFAICSSDDGQKLAISFGRCQT